MTNDATPTLELLKTIVDDACLNQEGRLANYIPELANANRQLVGIGVQTLQGDFIEYGNHALPLVTLQSVSKLIPLIGLLEEVGCQQVMQWVRFEPSGDDFASISRLENFGPKPSNPMLNAGAIALCSYIPGKGEQQFAWLEHWIQKLFNQRLALNPSVLASEKRTGNRNRSLAYLLKSNQNLGMKVTDTLDLYFTLCSYEALISQMIYLPVLLANGGKDLASGKTVISPETCKIAIAIMATCGLYDETGTYMVKVGIPAKSGVSGYTIAVVPGKAGIVALSPLVNHKGNSIRGIMMLEALSQTLGWHFALA